MHTKKQTKMHTKNVSLKGFELRTQANYVAVQLLTTDLLTQRLHES
jgi:hypothetical protein